MNYIGYLYFIRSSTYYRVLRSKKIYTIFVFFSQLCPKNNSSLYLRSITYSIGMLK